MQGLLADVNVEGHLPYLRRLLTVMGMDEFLVGIQFVTFPEVGLSRHIKDRALWTFCQNNEWILFTENRNDDGPDSLQATVNDSWHPGGLPILTLSDKGTFEHSVTYARRVAGGVVEILFGIKEYGQYRDSPRIYLPL